ncbi:hypothetical protein CJ745_24755 [Salmonella enterica subsp. enterica]|nr:hypothetical protein [Salmonella enterica]EAW1478424.1 hypothetical protein [Salmonella enterica subsp. enterica]EED9464809.1 hypothetical protein [Salmonella enterica subsp. enterica serovar Abaetetuba]EBP8539834.1 hypothetical protein [Salmonella enterica]EBR1116507.1 hypothetical protein [Salmonella enterica]
MADLAQSFSGKTGHFHDGAAVGAVLQHGTGNFGFAFITPFLFASLDTLRAFFPDDFLFRLAMSGYCQSTVAKTFFLLLSRICLTFRYCKLILFSNCRALSYNLISQITFIKNECLHVFIFQW